MGRRNWGGGRVNQLFGLGHSLCEMPIRHIIRVIKSGAPGRSQIKIEICSYLHVDGMLL